VSEPEDGVEAIQTVLIPKRGLTQLLTYKFCVQLRGVVGTRHLNAASTD